LTTVDLKSVIDAAKRLGVLEVIFSGGEPLLRPDMPELVRYAHDAGLLIRLNTNGLLLTRECAAELRRAGVTQCAVSIDDANPEIHDRLRGLPGLHKKATEGVRILREFNIPCQILTYAARENVTAGLERISALGRELGAFAVFIFFPMAVGRWDGAFDKVLTEEERGRVRDLQDMTLVHIELPTSHTPCCTYDGAVLHVTARGDATPCPFVPFSIGNVTEFSLDSLWKRYIGGMTLECFGECPMNFPESRSELRRYVESIGKEKTCGH
jgi:MoaA/NifB/PqqE/SkfB family radical SAM enzyme